MSETASVKNKLKSSLVGDLPRPQFLNRPLGFTNSPVRPPDTILVGGLRFYCNSSIVVIFRPLSSELAERNSAKIVHMLGIKYDLKTHVRKVGGGIPERSSHNILPMEGLAGKITSSLHESNFACYINGITSSADEYRFTFYNCISNITICGRTVEEDYPSGGIPYP